MIYIYIYIQLYIYIVIYIYSYIYIVIYIYTQPTFLLSVLKTDTAVGHRQARCVSIAPRRRDVLSGVIQPDMQCEAPQL